MPQVGRNLNPSPVDSLVEVSPHLELINAPQVMRPFQVSGASFETDPLDFEFGGLYSPEGIAQMETYFHTHRVAKVLSADMAKTAMYNNWLGTSDTTQTWLSPAQIGIHVPPPDWDPFGWISKYADGYEKFCTTIVVIWVTYRLLSWIGGMACRAWAGPPPGIKYPEYALCIVFPAFLMILKAHLKPRRRRHHSRRDRRALRAQPSAITSAFARQLRSQRRRNRSARFTAAIASLVPSLANSRRQSAVNSRRQSRSPSPSGDRSRTPSPNPDLPTAVPPPGRATIARQLSFPPQLEVANADALRALHLAHATAAAGRLAARLEQPRDGEGPTPALRFAPGSVQVRQHALLHPVYEESGPL